MSKKQPTTKSIETLIHEEAKLENIPTVEYQSAKEKEQPKQVHYHRNIDLNPQLAWREKSDARYGVKQTFAEMILKNLKLASVQRAHKEDKISFISLTPWPDTYVCAEGLLGTEGGYFICDEFSIVERLNLVEAAGDAGFDVLIGCAFNYKAHASELEKLGRIPVLEAG